eukprot:2804221-Alexandrium_andersonii.AAC.1
MASTRSAGSFPSCPLRCNQARRIVQEQLVRAGRAGSVFAKGGRVIGRRGAEQFLQKPEATPEIRPGPRCQSGERR